MEDDAIRRLLLTQKRKGLHQPMPMFARLSLLRQRKPLHKVIYPHDGCASSGVLSVKPGDVLEMEEAPRKWWTATLQPTDGKSRSKQSGFFYKCFTVPVVQEPKEDVIPVLGGQPFLEPSAENSITYEGKDYISTGPPGDEMKCVICHSLASKPHQTTCCGQTVCLACAEAWKKTNNSCPQCRQAPLNLSIDIRLGRNIGNLIVYCTNSCGWKDRLADASSHLADSCQYVEVTCENQKCRKQVQRCELKEHMESECQYRIVSCPCCGEKVKKAGISKQRQDTMTYRYLVTVHYKDCPSWPMRCPNKCPKDDLIRSSLQAHLDGDCPEQLISCPFLEAGCGVKAKRKEVEKHVQEAVGQHVSGMMKELVMCKKKLAEFGLY